MHLPDLEHSVFAASGQKESVGTELSHPNHIWMNPQVLNQKQVKLMSVFLVSLRREVHVKQGGMLITPGKELLLQHLMVLSQKVIDMLGKIRGYAWYSRGYVWPRQVVQEVTKGQTRVRCPSQWSVTGVRANLRRPQFVGRGVCAQEETVTLSKLDLFVLDQLISRLLEFVL